MPLTITNPVIIWFLDRIFPRKPIENFQYEDLETVWSEYHDNPAIKVPYYDECILYNHLILQAICDYTPGVK